MPSKHFVLCRPLPLLLSIFPNIGVFSNESVAKVLEFQHQHQSFQWILRTDLLYNRLVESPCSPRDSQESSQHYSSKPSIHLCSVFFVVQLSLPYMTIGKTIALTRQTFVGKVMPLLFNMLSKLWFFPLINKDKRLMEASWWETLIMGETGSCSDGRSHTQ